MKIVNLYLQYFRIFQEQQLVLSDLTLLYGGNGVGKTSLIEGIYLLSHGESFRAEKIDEMIAFDQPIARAGVRLADGESADVLEITLTRGIVQGQRTQKRLYSVNGAKKLKKNFVGKFLAVVFQPEDMRLVEGSPARRRAFINSVLSATFADYGQSLHIYDQALKRYNRLIDQVRDGKQPRSVLKYWELLLAKHGQVIQAKRDDFFNFIRRIDSPFSFDVRYHSSPITQEAIDSHQDRAIAAGHALVGPHKDDFSILFPSGNLENKELASYGSRGQQRLGVLWLKLGELKFLEEQKNQKPVLLLDDIFSELDESLENMVLKLVGKYQTVMTTANKETKDFLVKKLKHLSLVKIEKVGD